MIRDYLNTEDDLMESSAESAVLLPPKQPTCDLSVTDGLPVGMTYAPMQVFRKLYSPDEALQRGTLFCELDLPFQGGKKR